MSVVRHQLTDPTGAPVRATFDLELVGLGMRPDSETQIIAVESGRVADDGLWVRTVAPNVGAESYDGLWEGDFYRVTFRPDGQVRRGPLDFVVRTEGVFWLGDLLAADTLPEGHPFASVIRGSDGTDGEDGADSTVPGPPGSTPRGIWSTTTPYVVRDLVTYLGSSFMARVDNTGVTPVEGATWQLIGAKGDPGQSGGVADATTTVKGIAALMGGTAAAPTAPQDKVTGALSTPTANTLLRRDSNGRAEVAAPTGSTSTEITNVGWVNTRAVKAGGTAGQVYTKASSADFDASWQNPAANGAPIARYKTADTSRAATTTLTDDPDLAIASLAVGVYLFRAVLRVSGNAAGDIVVAFTGTATAAGAVRHDAFGTGTSTMTDARSSAFFDVTNALGVGIGSVFTPFRFDGVITVSAAGTFGLRWAQNATNATATVLGVGSYLSLQKIG